MWGVQIDRITTCKYDGPLQYAEAENDHTKKCNPWACVVPMQQRIDE